MIRRFLAVAAICLMPVPAAAQSTVLTINIARADVRMSPSIASPVIGEAPRGAVLEVTRDVGDWVKVAWPDAPDGAGYVRVSAGSLSGPALKPFSLAPSTRAGAGAESAASTPSVRADVQEVERRIFAHERTSEYVTPPGNTIGLGGSISGSTIGYGLSGRIWSGRGVGVQLDLSRYSVVAAGTANRVVSVQFAPSVLYALPEALTDYLRVRPYVGGGPRLWNSSLRTGGLRLASEKRHSWQVFGGTEVTLASAPRFAFSLDFRYDSSSAPFAGITFGSVGFTAAGHWYVR
jgi:hypothetical protein